MTAVPNLLCIVLHEVEGGNCPMSSPPWKQMLEPPPRRIGAQDDVKNCAVEASILVSSARLVSQYWDVFTPLRVMKGPSPLRQELVDVPLPTVKVKLVVFLTPPPVPVTVMT